MINAVSAVSTAKVVTPVKNEKFFALPSSARQSELRKIIDEKQNENLVIELDYIGKQLKTLLDIKAGREVKVEKYANKLPEDDFKTTAQKQKDDAIVQLGYIGDVLKKMVDVKTGNLEEEKPKKHATRG